MKKLSFLVLQMCSLLTWRYLWPHPRRSVHTKLNNREQVLTSFPICHESNSSQGLNIALCVLIMSKTSQQRLTNLRTAWKKCNFLPHDSPSALKSLSGCRLQSKTYWIVLLALLSSEMLQPICPYWKCCDTQYCVKTHLKHITFGWPTPS